MSIMAGALFGFPFGFTIVCFNATVGASNCYLLSHLLARNFIRKYFPDKIALFAKLISSHRDNLKYYMLFLRISPLLPNWFINISSPIIDIPLSTFAFATFFGIMPATAFCVYAGLTIQELQSASDALNLKALFSLFIIAFIVLIPTIFKDKLKKKLQ